MADSQSASRLRALQIPLAFWLVFHRAARDARSNESGSLLWPVASGQLASFLLCRLTPGVHRIGGRRCRIVHRHVHIGDLRCDGIDLELRDEVGEMLGLAAH